MNVKVELCVGVGFKGSLRSFVRELSIPYLPVIGMSIYFGETEDSGFVFSVKDVAYIVPKQIYSLVEIVEIHGYDEEDDLDDLDWTVQRLTEAGFEETEETAVTK